ncbi:MULTISPECIES: hypothetical protein [Arthrobacter]|uniref:hypothetical protein n=1 Tax=Arthrobacter sp. UNC362MFTsu5.1 TaxID=1449044 RepID=UPI0004820638|nr:hypothetical protein [Arthrobacter sp. UNC362MFTsu5.1]
MSTNSGRLAGIAERRIFKSYASLSSVPTGELEALACLLRNGDNTPGPNHAGLVWPVVLAELARRNGAEHRRHSRPDDPGH